MQKTISRPPAGDEADAPFSGAMAALAAELTQTDRDVLLVARNELRAEAAAAALRAFLPGEEVLVFLPRDASPYDRASPSRERMGKRIAVAARLAEPGRPRAILVTTPMGAIQRVPAAGDPDASRLAIATGDAIDADELRRRVEAMGYLADDRVDEPGEVAIRGSVIDIFAAADAAPTRIDHADGRVTGLWTYDPVTQMTIEARERIAVLPAAEETVGAGPLPALADLLAAPRIVLDAGAAERGEEALGQIADSYETAKAFRGADGSGETPIEPERLHLDPGDWRSLAGAAEALPATNARPVPRFARERDPAAAFRDFIGKERAAGRTVALVGRTPSQVATMVRRARLGTDAARAVEGLAGLDEIAAGGVATIAGEIEAGFVDEERRLAVVAAADLLGRRAASPSQAPNPDVFRAGDAAMRPGDLVVHVDHGIARLAGIETIDAGEGPSEDAIVLVFADDAKLMVPAREIGRIWRYGGDADAVALDRLGGSAWPKRKAELARDLSELAQRLVALAEARQAATAPKLQPDPKRFRRFVEAFPFRATPDQENAVDDVLADLASGRPMDRLACGDVGFGKTEVALRAAAAAILAGRQVAVAAPTTVLVRQHVETFRRRFAGLGIEVAQLSRLAGSAEARAVKQGLASGDTRLVIGTHALAGKQVSFADLGLLIVDEEHRFGARQKEALRALGEGVHVLTLTATPIPRTLEAALVGIRDLSIIATPPAPRLPIATFMTRFDPVSVRAALMREKARGGQSFVVCPRIEDIAPMAAKLAEIVPELHVAAVHGRMTPAEVDGIMVDFAGGTGDVLLATNIIESGLDVPRANTLLIWRPDRFGMAQLHQLRGRVGRGRRRGTAYLLTEPGKELAPATEKRLRTLAAFDRLGSGFALSARDLDHRGAGDLVGEEQAGHIRMIGAELYQSLLARAVKEARGEAAEDEWTSEVQIGLPAYVPADYVPEPELRIDLHVRLARMGDEEETADIEAEIDDRFGPLPEPVRNLVTLATLARLCHRAGIARLDAGPSGIAVTLHRPFADAGALLSRGIGADVVEREGRLVAKVEAETGGSRGAICLAAARALADHEASGGRGR